MKIINKLFCLFGVHEYQLKENNRLVCETCGTSKCYHKWIFSSTITSELGYVRHYHCTHCGELKSEKGFI